MGLCRKQYTLAIKGTIPPEVVMPDFLPRGEGGRVVGWAASPEAFYAAVQRYGIKYVEPTKYGKPSFRVAWEGGGARVGRELFSYSDENGFHLYRIRVLRTGTEHDVRRSKYARRRKKGPDCS